MVMKIALARQRLRYLKKSLTYDAQFYFSPRKRREWRKALEDCKDLDAWYGFSQKVFGITQIRKEIIPFLQFVDEQVAPKQICEIGTQSCGNMFLFSRAFRAIEHLIGVDLVVQNWPRMKYFSRPGVSITAVNGSSYSPATIARVTNRLKGRKLDFLFIDGDHRYDGVKRDFLGYAPLVRNGGIIAFHDICPDDGTGSGAYAGDVPLFWQRVKKHFKSHQFVKNEQQHGCGIGAIEYDANVSVSGTL